MYRNHMYTEEVNEHVEDNESNFDEMTAEFPTWLNSSEDSGFEKSLDQEESFTTGIKSETNHEVLSVISNVISLKQATNNDSQKPAEMEFLEENNNIMHMRSIDHEKNRFSESPKPGCSKDFNDISSNYQDEEFCSACNFEDLQKDAKQIHDLLPKFDYFLIYTVLSNNRFAQNRIELTLWDLLPKERPKSRKIKEEFLHKRQCLNKTNFMECEDLNIFSKKDSAVLEKEKQTHVKNEMKDIKIKYEESTLVDKNYGMKRDITNEATALDNADNANQSMEPKAKLYKLDILNKDINSCIVHDSENSTSLIGKVLETERNIKIMEGTKNMIEKTATSSNVNNIHQQNMVQMRKAKLSNVYNSKKSVSCSIKYDSKNKESQLSKDSVLHKTETDSMAAACPKIAPKLNTILRPARFKFDTSDTSSTFVPPLSRSPFIPILSEPKLKYPLIESAIRKLPDMFLNERSGQVIQTYDTLPENKKASGMNAAQSHSFVNSVRDSTTVSQKTPLNLEYKNTETKGNNSLKNINIHIKPKLLKTVDNDNTLQPVQSDGTIDMATLNAVKTAHNWEEGNNLKQEKDNMNTEDIVFDINIKNEKQRPMLLNNAETNISKKQEKTANNADSKEIVLNKRAHKIYYRLIPMFPSVNTNYMKALCKEWVEDNAELSDETVLQFLAENLLDKDKEHSFDETVKPSLPIQNVVNSYDVNEQYADLLGIFPEADPVYLRDTIEQIYNDPEKIKEFVQSKLENPDYPTREQYLTKKKITEQQRQYTTDFQVGKFLKIFPNPFLHFENEKRICQFNPHAVDFLKHYFSKIRVNTLLYIYSKHVHNLSLTAKSLETMTSDMKTKRTSNRNMLTEDIPLLQEIAFIQHKAEIKKHLAELKANEEKTFNELKAKNALFVCQCCYDDECLPSKCSTCEDGHIFCNSCITKSIDVTLADGKTHTDCLINCGSAFPLSVIQQILPPVKFSILLCKRQEAEIMAAGVEGLVSCPFCHFASIPPPEDKVFKCFNPDCMKESCRLCKEANHIPLKCNEIKSDIARLYLEEKMTEALVRKCWKCEKTFIKEEGCNKMTCPCGAQMCYICDKPIKDYRHFEGQGGSGSNLCPLWSDDSRINAESVIKVCYETMKHIKKKDPAIDIDVKALLPKLPPKRSGPHENVAFANEIPEHANRIARQIP